MKPTFTRRRILQGLSTSAALVAAGRAPAVAAAAPNAAAAFQDPASTPTAGGVLKWGFGFGGTGPSFPWTLPGGANYSTLVRMSHPGPFFRNHNLELEPDLAETYEYNEDYTAFTVTLKQGITWSDGTPFTAQDLYGTLLMAHPEVTTQGAMGAMALIKGGRDYFLLGTTLEPPAGIQVIDDHTIQVELEEPWSDAVWQILGGLQLAPWHIYQPLFENPESRQDLSEFESPIFLEPQMQISTGPFIFEEGDMERYLRYVKNPSYHGPEPLLDALEFINFGSTDATIIALERGEVDVTTITDVQYLRSVQEMEDVAVHEALDYYLRFFRYNWSRPYLGDPRVYQAIDMAIERGVLCDQVLGGACTAWRQYGPGTEGFDQNSYDPERARALLAEANWDASIDLEIMTDYSDDQTQELLPAIVAMLGEVGIKAHSRIYDGPALQAVVAAGEIDLWYDGTWTPETFSPGQFDLPTYVDAEGNEYAEPGPGRELQSHRMTAFGFHPEWIRNLYTEHRTASPERREEIRTEVEERLAEEGSSYMILARYKRFVVARNTCHGLDNPDTILWISDPFVNKSMTWTWWKE